jgi:hypothetical protein
MQKHASVIMGGGLLADIESKNQLDKKAYETPIKILREREKQISASKEKL